MQENMWLEIPNKNIIEMAQVQGSYSSDELFSFPLTS